MFQKILDSAMPLIDFLWMIHTAGRDLSTPEARAGVADELKNTVKTIADPEVQRHYSAFVQERVAAHFFPRRDFRAGKGSAAAAPRPLPLRPRMPVFKDIAPRILIAGIINHPHIYEAVEEEFGHIECAPPRLNALRQAVAACLSEQEALDRQGLLHHLTHRGFEKETGDILNETVYVHAAFVAPEADSASVQAKWREFYNAFREKLPKTA